MNTLRPITHRLLLASLFLVIPVVMPTSVSTANPAQPATWADQLQAPQPKRETEKNTFTGKIAQSNNGKYVLQDSATNASFILDDQMKASSFMGKTVKVTGTLDPSNTVIHVIEIEAV